MEPSKKYRGKIQNVILDYVTDRLTGRDNLDKRRVFITHTRCEPEWVDAVRSKVKELVDFEEILETTAGATVTTHCGPSTLGVLYIRKP